MSCMIIAEAGVNHNGSLAMAARLVDLASDCGCDIVKFQTFKAEKLVTSSAPKARYQTENMRDGGTQLAMLKALELPDSAFVDLAAHCASRGIEFLSTPFDADSAQFLAGIGMKRIKVSSGDLTNKPFLRELARIGLPIILSSGMATLGEIEDAVDVVESAGLASSDITLLHCTTEYPAPASEVNLRAMRTIAAAFPASPFGYSDHTAGIEIPVAAVALGAQVIEKHITLDRALPGPDHLASLQPEDLHGMVAAIRNVELALGDGRKRPTASEIPNVAIARKSIVAARPIGRGETFDAMNLTSRRPGTGISPMAWDEVVGLMSDRDYSEGDPICWPRPT